MDFTNLMSNLKDGFVLMFLGMGFVFLFLTIMIYVMQITSFLVQKLNKLYPEEAAEDKYVKKNDKKDDSETALAVGGNMTIIGAAANVIVSESAAHKGHPISFMKFLKYGFVTMLISLAISSVYIYLRFYIN